MKRDLNPSPTRRVAPLLGIVFTFLAAFSISVQAQGRQRMVMAPQRDLQGTPILPANSQSVPESTLLILVMETPLSSGRSRVSDRFEATIATAVIDANGRTLIPEGAIVVGRVTNATPAKLGGRSGTIGITFDYLMLDGKQFPIRGFLVPADERTRKQMDNEGNFRGGSSLKRTFLFIGGGAGAGATVASLSSAGLLAATGIGAAAGLTASLLWKGKDAVVQPGQRIGLELTAPLNVRSPYGTGRNAVLPVNRRGGTTRNGYPPIIPDTLSPRPGATQQNPADYDPNAIRTSVKAVPIYDVRAERSGDGYLRALITAETPTANWRIYTHHQINNNNTLEVRLRGWPPASYGSPQISHPSAPAIIVQDRNNQITRVVVHGSNGSRTLTVGGSNTGFFDQPVDRPPAQQPTSPPYRPRDYPADGSQITIGPPLGSTPTRPTDRATGTDSGLGGGSTVNLPSVAVRVANELETFQANLAASVGLWRNRDGSYDEMGQRRVTSAERQLVEGIGYMIDSARRLGSPQITTQERRSYAQRLRDDFQVVNQRWMQTNVSADINTRWKTIQQSVTNLINAAYR